MSLCAGKREGAGIIGRMPAPLQDNFFQLASSVQGNPGIYLAAKLGGCDVKLLLDTGAQVSIIPKQRWLTITNGGAYLEHHEGVVRVANGGRMPILGRWQTVCQFDSLTVIQNFLLQIWSLRKFYWARTFC